MNPKYPIYIVSKGRHESRLTSKILEELNVPYKIVIEPQEFELYNKYINEDKILVLPFSNLEQGSIPARNWIWEHSISSGAEKHWVLDDNIRYFRRYNDDKKYLVTSGTIFRIAEIFCDRYENIALSGFQYSSFMAYNRQKKPYDFNTRIYSCILIDNKIPFRWRGKYNEDSDLSIRVLKNNYCTVLFNCFLQDKQSTMKMKGGNTNELYHNTNDRYEFAESLQNQHPDCVKIIRRYNRWHHSINFNNFKKNRLIKKEGIIVKDVINEYGMILK